MLYFLKAHIRIRQQTRINIGGKLAETIVMVNGCRFRLLCSRGQRSWMPRLLRESCPSMLKGVEFGVGFEELAPMGSRHGMRSSGLEEDGFTRRTNNLGGLRLVHQWSANRGEVL